MMKIFPLLVLVIILSSCTGTPYESKGPFYQPPESDQPVASLQLVQSDFRSAYYSTCDADSGQFHDFHKWKLLSLDDDEDGEKQLSIKVLADKVSIVAFLGYSVSGSCSIAYALFPKEGKSYQISMDEMSGDYCVVQAYEIQQDGTNVDIKDSLKRNRVPCGKLDGNQNFEAYKFLNSKYQLCENLENTVARSPVHISPDNIGESMACREILNAKSLDEGLEISKALLKKYLAIDSSNQTYINHLTYGGPRALSRAARGIYANGEKSTKILDWVAEALLLRYRNPPKYSTDALAWLARALGLSGNGRYHSALKNVVENAKEDKVKKYARLALSQVGTPSGVQYEVGMVRTKETN